MHRRSLIAACAAGLILPVIAASTAAAAAAPGAVELALSGTVSQVVVDPLPGHSGLERTETMIQIAGRALDVPDGMAKNLRSGQPVTVRIRVAPGTRASRAIEAADRGRASVLSIRATGATAAASAVLGAHTLTILPVYWASPDSATETSLAGQGAETAAYWAEQSDNQIKISTTVASWKQIPDPSSCSNYTTIFNAALAANGRSAATSKTDHVMVYFPYRADCGWAGRGTLNGPNIWINGPQRMRTWAHEFGHNFGLHHANTATCTSGAIRVSLSNTCTVNEYGDGADVMGSRVQTAGNLNTAHADQLGLSTTVTASATSPTTVDLAPLANTTATRSVRVDTSTGPVFIDFRPAAGRDVVIPGWAGVQVHRRPLTNPLTSELLDMQPTLAAAFTNPSLPLNAVWPVPGADVVVRVTQLSSSARVEVVPKMQAPALTYPGPGAVINKTKINATWESATSNPDITGYRLTVNGVTARATLPAGSTSAPVTLRSGANTLSVAAVTSNGLTPSTPVAVVVDTTAPATPTKPAISSDNNLTWIPAQDTGTAVSFLVRFDSDTPITVNGSSVAAPSTPGAHTYTVTARDAAGNLSKPVTKSYWWDPTPPVAPQLTAPSDSSVLKTASATVSWTGGSDGESGILGYRVTVNGTASPKLVNASATSTKVNLRAGSNTVTVAAVNQAGSSTASTPAIVTVDTKAPAAVSKLALSAGGLLSWTAATDTGTPVTFTVSLDGGVATRTVGTSRQVDTPAGRHTWTVIAQDAAGNQSSAARLTVVR